MRYKFRLVVFSSVLISGLNSSLALAACDDSQHADASRIAQEALSGSDDVGRVIMLKRSLKICPDFAIWLELGKTELSLGNPIDAAYALENARDFYTADKNNTYTRSQLLRQAIANSWLAETYKNDDELALATVATQEATSGYESLGQTVPIRLIKLQAEIDDALANADATVLARSLNIQHERASRGIGVRQRVRTENESNESQIETNQLLVEYSGDANVQTVAQLPPTGSLPANTTAESTTTESRLNIPVLFEFDSDQLSAASLKTVAQLGAAISALNLADQDSVKIVGHTDSQGSEAYNLALSLRRAESVLRQIKIISEVDSELVASGKGESELRYKGKDQNDHRRNRRVEVVVVR